MIFVSLLKELIPYPAVWAQEMLLEHHEKPLPSRQHQIASLREQHYDILVIGGGATGCGIALDAISRGAFVILFEVAVWVPRTVRLSYYPWRCHRL